MTIRYILSYLCGKCRITKITRLENNVPKLKRVFDRIQNQPRYKDSGNTTTKNGKMD